MGDQVFHFIDIEGMRYSHDREPEFCPLCHHAVHVQQRAWTLVEGRWKWPTTLEIVFQCPRPGCGRLFIGRYEPTTRSGDNDRIFGLFVLNDVVPQEPKPPEFPEEVSHISPGFVEIYAEASAAESSRLMQIAGVGYRKALEFLIKDYCIHLRTGGAEKIKETLLGPCINHFVDDPNVKECARRAAWLGNDETHYSRRWADRDIDDLKILIQLTVNWIHTSALTRRYIAEMPQGGG